MTDKHKQTLEERSRDFEVSFINQPISFEVDFEVQEETARERADRVWKMPKEK